MTIEDIALTMTPGVGVKGTAHLLEVFGDARSVFAATETDLRVEAELRADLAKAIIKRKGFPAAEKELRHCEKYGITALASTDADYPQLLRDTPDYPHVLYIKGDQALLRTRCLAMVGTRDATPYGQIMCNRLVESLGRKVPALTIVSGLAFGIDVAAHRAALAAEVPTIAVLPCPLPDIMPAQHTAVARDILEHGGALITEESSQTKMRGHAYIPRNRIIAGLCAGTLVVESPDQGGSLITASMADGYNRTVMAVPGRVTDKSSRGTNYLIKTRKAQMVLSAEDILEELMWDCIPDIAVQSFAPKETRLTADEEALLALFTTSDPVSIEELALRSNSDTGRLATQLIGLELSGAIMQLPGHRYIKTK